MTHPVSTRAKPFVKWAGGKQQLLAELTRRIPTTFKRYFEPFVGSGALFFALSPQEATLSDANAELIATYEAVRDFPEMLVSELRKHVNTPEHFKSVRAASVDALSLVERAARVIYLNRTCFNGLYRVNRKGQFNTPYGRYKNPRIVNEEGIYAANKALQGVTLLCDNYASVVEAAKEGDFVYLDPPYLPVSEFSDFRRYHRMPFGNSEHVALAKTFADLAARGCFVMLSNSTAAADLYSEWTVDEIPARRNINSKGDRRGNVTEILVTSFDW